MNYVKDVIDFDAAASEIMYDVSRKTFNFREEVEVIDDRKGGLAALRVKPGKKIAIHGAVADPWIDDIPEYAASLVSHLRAQARFLNARPIAFFDTIARSDVPISAIEQVAESLYSECRKYKLAILNGENAKLGSRVNAPLNLSGVMLSYINHPVGVFGRREIPYIVIEADGRLAYGNCDGEGTKIEVKERTGQYGMEDAIAMIADDAARKMGDIRALYFVMEAANNESPLAQLWRSGKAISEKIDSYFAIHREVVGERVAGYGSAPYNIEGTCISFIDEQSVKGMPSPKEGDYLFAIRNPENPFTFRSNGITEVREGFNSLYGSEWHRSVYSGITAGNWAGSPSTVFYPLVKRLFSAGLISGFFHMSGGAFKEKLAEPLADLGLGARLDNLYEPSPAMRLLAESQGITMEEAYRIWNMGNEAFVTTGKPDGLMNMLGKLGLEGRPAASQPLRKGLKLIIDAYNGEEVIF